MNILALLENGLFALGQVLRFPVMALLWICVAASLFMAGSCLIELVARRRERSGFMMDRWLKSGTVLDTTNERKAQLPASLRQLLADVENARLEHELHDGALEHLVLEREERVRKILGGPRMLVKVGPSLGLLGTLIPMGQSRGAGWTVHLEVLSLVSSWYRSVKKLAPGNVGASGGVSPSSTEEVAPSDMRRCFNQPVVE